MTSRTFNHTIAAASSGLPSYLQNASPFQWVAAGTGTAYAVRPVPTPGTSVAHLSYPYTGNPFSFSGATVEQTRKELLVFGGGHTDYGGNEYYAYNVPAGTCKRLTESSTDEVLKARNNSAEYNNNHLALGEAFLNTDGIPHSIHSGTEQQWLNGRVWFTSQTATATDSLSVAACLSFDRDAVGNPITPLAWPANAAPWRVHGNGLGTNFNYGGFGCSAADAQRNRAWGVESSNGGRLWSINTSTGVAEGSRVTRFTVNNFYPAMWACCAPDLGILVIGRGRWTEAGITGPRVSVFNITSGTPVYIGDSNVNTTDTNGQSVYYDEVGVAPAGQVNDVCFGPAYGSVYHAASKSILLFEARRKPSGQVIQLRIPNSGGAYTSGVAWAVTLRNQHASTANPSWPSLSGGQSMNSRFNLIEDIGNGEPVLVAAPAFDQPVYVCRIGSLA
jgi:hypothetical protein